MTVATFSASRGRAVVDALIGTIDANAMLLSEIDGAIGDGDHGVNMRKGFTRARQKFSPTSDLIGCLEILGDTLLTEIGGSMGPLYGTFFEEMARVAAGCPDVGARLFGSMLDAGIDAVVDLGGARVGDKTLVDVMVPARDAYHASLAMNGTFADALDAMASAADQGRDSTRDLVARVGRASRLGERSRGVVDPGATSCALLLTAFATSIRELLSETDAETQPT
jgi:phosphoenolpyruvate---glycerone phosphotransferase subunit DhaL